MDLRTEADLRKFFEGNYERGVRQAYRILNDAHQAEDVVQDCFVRLWEKRLDICNDQPLQPYFSRMVRNRCIDMLRKKILHDESAEIEFIPDKVSDGLEYEDIQKAVNTIIDSLPERCRQVFVLSRFENMSYKEISEELKISPKTVENQMGRALAAMKAGLGKFYFVVFV